MRAKADIKALLEEGRACDVSYLELALRAALPLATLDADLLRAETKAGVERLPIE